MEKEMILVKIKLINKNKNYLIQKMVEEEDSTYCDEGEDNNYEGKDSTDSDEEK
jgi:hypothetical protein